MTITVFSKPSCVQCNATYRALDKHGLDYEVVDLTQDDAALSKMIELGYQQAPIVFADDQQWTGFRPDLIKAAAVRSQAA